MVELTEEDCRHLKGTWERQGKFSIMDCENLDYQIIIEVDSPQAFELFEEGNGAIQRFGKPLSCVSGDDEEKLEEWIQAGLKLN